MKLQTRQIVLAGLMGALLMVLKEILAPVPGVEPVSLLVILYTLCLPAAAPWAHCRICCAGICPVRFWALELDVFVYLVYPVWHCIPAAPHGQCGRLGCCKRCLRVGIWRIVYPCLFYHTGAGRRFGLVDRRYSNGHRALPWQLFYHAAALPPPAQNFNAA